MSGAGKKQIKLTKRIRRAQAVTVCMELHYAEVAQSARVARLHPVHYNIIYTIFIIKMRIWAVRLRQMVVKIDLWKDFAAYAKQELGRDSSASDFEAVRMFEWWNMRRIPPKRRIVQLSEELKHKKLSKEIRGAIENIKKISESGESLNFHLSTAIEKIYAHDNLLVDWGIHHLHLGIGNKIAKSAGFVNRGKDLAFVCYDDFSLYVIDVINHNGFCKKSLLEILNSNWPHLISKFRIGGVIQSSDEHSDKEIHELRKKGVNVFIEIDGHVYAPPGGGVAADGYSIEATIRADMRRAYMDGISQVIRESWADIIRVCREKSGKNIDHLDIELVEYDRSSGRFVIKEKNSGVLIQLSLIA